MCLRSPSPSASLRATHPASVHPLSAVRYRPPLRAPWVDDSETSASRRHTLPAPIPAKLLARLCNLLMVLYPKVLIRKEGTYCHAPSGSSISQTIRYGFQRRTVQHLRRFGHGKVEEPNGLSVTVLRLDNRTTSTVRRDFSRYGVTVRNGSQDGFGCFTRRYSQTKSDDTVIPDVRRNRIGSRLLGEQHHAPARRPTLADDGSYRALTAFDQCLVFLATTGCVK